MGIIIQWKVYERGTICQCKVYERGIFSAKNGIKEGKGSDLGAEPPRFLGAPPGGRTRARQFCLCK